MLWKLQEGQVTKLGMDRQELQQIKEMSNFLMDGSNGNLIAASSCYSS